MKYYAVVYLDVHGVGAYYHRHENPLQPASMANTILYISKKAYPDSVSAYKDAIAMKDCAKTSNDFWELYDDHEF